MKKYIQPTVKFHKLKRIEILASTNQPPVSDDEQGTDYSFSKSSRFNWEDSKSKSGGLFTDDEEK